MNMDAISKEERGGLRGSQRKLNSSRIIAQSAVRSIQTTTFAFDTLRLVLSLPTLSQCSTVSKLN